MPDGLEVLGNIMKDKAIMMAIGKMMNVMDQVLIMQKTERSQKENGKKGN